MLLAMHACPLQILYLRLLLITEPNALQVGAERFNLFKGCPKARTATMVLRGGSEQFIDEAERSLHDAIMIVRRAIKNASVVAGGGAIDMEISRCCVASCHGMSFRAKPPMLAVMLLH